MNAQPAENLSTAIAAKEAGAPLRPMIAYVVHSLNPGGTEKLVIEMSLAFAGEFDVQVFCLDEPGLWAGTLRARGIPVHCLWRQPGTDLMVAVRLARALRRRKAQIIHAHQCTPWFYAALSRLLYHRPRLLLEEHGRFFPEVDRPVRRWINRLLIRRLTDHFVAVSAEVRHRLQRYEGLTDALVQVIYNGVSFEPPLTREERGRIREELGFGEKDFIIGTIGRFDPIKNLPMLVQSIAAARALDERIVGMLVGEGPELPAIRTLVERLGLADAVRLTGFRSDARRLAQCLDLFVLSSFSEGTSMALLEAICTGVPVAVTDVGGNPEVVLAGQTGWVIPSRSVESLTAAILEAASDAQHRYRLAQAGRQRFEQHFTFERMVASYRDIYQSLIGTGGREQ
jgi:glycosyltransferase involved in cell wall biosynthesis